jgi:N-acetylmuramoyl-L-alanine amidase CwlA
MDIQKQIIPDLPKVAFRHGAGKYEGVVAHSTDTPEATAQAESNYFHRAWKSAQAFVHFFVDWDGVIQTADTNYRAWGAGAVANQWAVHVELCETKDNVKFQKAYSNYINLLAKLLKDKNLTIDNLYTHDEITRKFAGTTHHDPVDYLASHSISIVKLKDDVNKILNPPKPAQPAKTRLVVVDVDSLNIRKIPSWDSSAICGKVKKGDAFTIIKELPEFYQIKSGFYITKSNKYVHTKEL